MKMFFSIATLALCLVSSAAFADTRGDFMNNPEAYGSLTVNKALPNGRMISYDIPVHASLLGGSQAATSVAAHGRLLATSIGYLKPSNTLPTAAWGMAKTPYAN